MLVFNRRVTGSGQITSQGFLTLQSDSALANYQGEVVVYGALTYVSWLKIDNGTNAQIPWLHVESVTSLYTAQVNVLGSLTVSSQLVLKGFSDTLYSANTASPALITVAASATTLITSA